MKLAFCLFNYFPFGGLQRDFLRIAKACVARGHEVHVYTMKWEGDFEPDLHVHIVPVKGWQNHTRSRAFAAGVQAILAKDPHDLVVGFSKMPGLDVYYAADVCFEERVRERHGFLYRLLPRYRQLAAMERAVFAHAANTDILLISPRQEAAYRTHYYTERSRFFVLPPGISKDRMASTDAAAIREAWRATFDIPEDDFLLLMVGSGFKTKGLDRAITGLAALPTSLRNHSHLFVIGQDKPDAFIALAKRLDVTDQVKFLGGRVDVPEFLLAADLLVHPAYHENTGTVLLEAVVAGLPVLTVDVCGYAPYIIEAEAGMVLASPFQQTTFNTTLEYMLLSPKRQEWQKNGLAFAKIADIYSLPIRAAELIERIGRDRERLSSSRP